MNKITILIGFLIVFFFVFPSYVSASDLTVTCNGSNCSSNGTSLFNQTNIAPGYFVTKTITIDNSSNSDSCNLHLLVTRNGVKQDPDLGDKIITVIKDHDNTYFGDDSGDNPKSLNDLFDKDVSLNVVNSNSSKEYLWSALFDYTSDNNYQNTNTEFSFSINFSCGSEQTSSQTSYTTSSISSSNSSSLGVLGIENSNTRSNSSRINRSQSNLLSNILDIENENTSEVSSNTSSSNLSSSTTNNTNSDNTNVLGVVCENSNFSWWIILLIQIILSVILLIVKYIKFNVSKLWLLPILLGILSQVLHIVLGCNCTTGFWCSIYIFLNIAAVLLGLVSYYLIIRFKTIKQK